MTAQQQQTAVVVGVGPGLGSALVNGLAAAGYTVFAAARTPESVTGAASGAHEPGRVVPVACDATIPAQVQSLFELAEQAGPLSIASRAPRGPTSSIYGRGSKNSEKMWARVR